MIERNIEVRLHGRYVVRPASGQVHGGLLLGFHGYAESADTQFARLDVSAGPEWHLVSIQGLHCFYQRRTDQVVASWMTRQNRESAIADNIAYVSQVIDREAPGLGPGGTVVFAGFSQGVAMAFRGAASWDRAVRHVIAVGGDIPPELEPQRLAGITSVLLCRGNTDPWYSDVAFRNDVSRLRDAGVTVRPLEIEGGHEWSAELATAVADYLGQCLSAGAA